MRGLMSLLSGMAQGYVAGTDKQYDRDRQAKMDQIVLDRGAREQADYARADTERQGLMAAAAPVVPTNAEVYQPTVDDDGNTMPANPTIGMQRVAGMQGLMPPAAAQAAAETQNALPARARRQGDFMAGIGKVAEAQRYSEAARFIEKEGHLDLVRDNAANAPTLSEVAAGKTDFDLTGHDRFNKVGGARIPDGSKGQAFITKTATGEDVVDWRVVGPDGKPVVPASALQIETVYGMSQAERRAETAGARKFMLEREDKRQDNTRQEARDRAQEGYQGRMASVAEQNAKTNEGYRRDMAAAAATRADAAMTKVESGGSKSTFERMDEVDKRRHERATKRASSIQSAIDKGVADGSLTTDSPAYKELSKQLAVKEQEADEVEAKYAGGPTRSDTLGLRAKPATQVPAQTVPSPSLPPRSTTVQGPKLMSSLQTSPVDIPPPPVEAVLQTVRTPTGMVTKNVPNPAFLAWRQNYGAAFDEKQRQEAAAANAGARSAWRPEAAPFSMSRVGR